MKVDPMKRFRFGTWDVDASDVFLAGPPREWRQRHGLRPISEGEVIDHADNVWEVRCVELAADEADRLYRLVRRMGRRE